MIIESIFYGDNLIIPLADIQHIEKLELNGEPNGLWIISSHTRYNFEHDIWENPIYIPEKLADKFIKSWCSFRDKKERIITNKQELTDKNDWDQRTNEFITCIMQRCELKIMNDTDRKLVAKYVQDFLSAKE